MNRRLFSIANHPKNVFQRAWHVFAIFLVLFTGCGPKPAIATPTDSIYKQAAQTAVVQLPTAASAPTVTTSSTTATPVPPPTAILAPSATPSLATSPTPTPLPLFPLDGYVMLFVKDGDLYFQDGNNLPVKLPHIGKISQSYLISDDNRKIVFSRGDGNEYSINADGSQEKIIITKVTNDLPPSSESGTFTGIVGFVPGTHQLLFETAVCKSQEFKSPCSISLFLADADTTVIKNLGGFGLAIQEDSENRSVAISPDGKMVAVGTADGVDILTMDGKILRHHVLPYKPSTSTILFPSLFWLPDSSSLIVALPNIVYYTSAFGNYPASTIWRYTIYSRIAVQIPFNPPPMDDSFQVSPDGNWIVYGGLSEYDPAVFLGNLANGHTQPVGDAIQVDFSWEPDSKHFIARSAESFLGTIDTSAFIPICQLNEWIDSRHFTCRPDEEHNLRLRMAEIKPDAVKIYDLGFSKDVEFSVLINPK